MRNPSTPLCSLCGELKQLREVLIDRSRVLAQMLVIVSRISRLEVPASGTPDNLYPVCPEFLQRLIPGTLSPRRLWPSLRHPRREVGSNHTTRQVAQITSGQACAPLGGMLPCWMLGASWLIVLGECDPDSLWSSTISTALHNQCSLH